MAPAEGWEKLRKRCFPELPFDCGNEVDPGELDNEDVRDCTQKATSKDQLRIERYIDRFDLHDKRLLHIGIGNSGLAKRFSGRVKEIVGTTIDQPEIDLALSVGLPAYTAILQNKYGGRPDLAAGLFDFIVDNNPTSPCCCMTHLAALFELYAAKLAPGGQIVTHCWGLAWIPPGSNPRWSFDFDDLVEVAALAGLNARKINRNIFVLSRGTVLKPGLGPRLRNIGRRIKAFPGRAVQGGPPRLRRIFRGIARRRRRWLS